jgi:hypothetical protein
MPDTPSASVSSSRAATGFRLGDLLRFEKMITPTLVRLVYYVGSVLLLITGLVLVYTGATSRFAGGMQVISGLFTIAFGPLLLRIACEQIIVLFGIYDRLGQIRDQSASD